MHGFSQNANKIPEITYMLSERVTPAVVFEDFETDLYEPFEVKEQ